MIEKYGPGAGLSREESRSREKPLAYWASETKTWDVAAGWLLVREAGGVVEGRHGPLDLTRPKFIAGANRELTSQLRQTIDGDG